MMNLYQKLIEVRKCVPYLQKENSGEQYKYVSSSQVLGNVKAKLDELGILLIPVVDNHSVTTSAIEFTNDKGQVTKRTNTYFTELDMTMTWVNAEKPDEREKCTWYGQGVDIAGEKGVGKALTYAEKYFMLKFFNIPTDKDDPDAFQRRIDDEPEPPKKDEPKADQPKQVKPTLDQIKEIGILAQSKNVSLKVKGIEWTGKASSQLWTMADYNKVKANLETPEVLQ